jgi:Tol biopolymer transport system component
MRSILPLVGLAAVLATAASGAATALPLLVLSTTHTRWSDTRVYVVRPGAAPRPLAVGSLPTVSPDGRSIAFLTVDRAHDGVLHVMSADGTGQRTVGDVVTSAVEVRGLVWSPDSSRVAVAGLDRTTIFELSTGYRDDVIGASALAFSPDGRQIAYEGFDTHGLVLADVHGLGAHVVAADLDQGLDVAWSPDGRWIAVERPDVVGVVDVAVVHPDGSGERRLARTAYVGLGGLAWSPGGRVAWLAGGRLSVATPTGHPRTLAKLAVPQAPPAGEPSWSSDGRSILVRTRTGLVLVDSATGHVRKLPLRYPAETVTSAGSFLGSRVVFAAHERERDLELALVRADGSGFRLLTANGVDDRAPSWSPDGGTIVFARTGARQHGIYTLRADGRGLRRLTTGDDDAPVFSPDGNSIAFVRAHAIRLIPARGGRARTLATTQFRTRQLSWTPDGRSLVFSDADALQRLDVATGTVTPIPLQVDPGSDAYRPVVSPDGTRIAFRGYVNAHEYRDPEAYGIYVARIDGSDVHKLASGFSGPTAWSPDGSTLAATDGVFLTLVSLGGATPDLFLPRLDGSFGVGHTVWASFRPSL